MDKVKFFVRGSYTVLEKDINDFISNTDNNVIAVKDIKFQEAPMIDSVRWNHISVMLIYTVGE